jgi:PAS domain S-box-containing protein
MPAGSAALEGERGHRQVAGRILVLACLVIAYRLAFMPLHGLIGNPAFLFGLGVCLTAAALLGFYGALATIAIVALIDRGFALALPSPETSQVAAVVAILVKLVLGGGLGLALDSRRRLAALSARLRREVEAREQTVASLRRSEDLHRALVESLGEGVGLCDEHDRVLYANQSLADTLEVPRDELLDKTFSEFLLNQSGEWKRSDDAKTRSYEATLKKNTATLLLVTETEVEPAASAQPLTLRVVRDLTERIVSERRQRDLERELQRSQSLQSLAVMAGGVAHDFNNLLCGVIGNAEIAERKLSAEAPPMLAQCLREILNFGTEAAQLSKQMLAYAGQRSLGIEALDSNDELTNALRLLHATVESKARLVLDLAPSLPEVAADRFQLRQVVTNLVLNALDAMAGTRGVLTLRTARVRLEADGGDSYELSHGDYVKFTVEDTGIGIPADARDRLFDPFFSTKAAGRGMGLAAAAGIVRAHRGWIGVERTSESGTAFGVLWPVARERTPRRTTPPTMANAPPARRKILLIDDEPAVRVVTTRLLTELGQRVVTADSGRLGLELFSKQRDSIELVVLDLTMPEQSGEQILDALRLIRDDVPVVITSGFQASDASRLLSTPNVIGFLDKPHTLTNLEMVLASVRPAAAATVAAPVSHLQGSRPS